MMKGRIYWHYSQHAEMEPIVKMAVDAIKKHRFGRVIIYLQLKLL